MAIYETRKGRIVGVIQSQSPLERPAPNRRMAPRRRSTVPGLIYPDGKRTPVPCTIADMSVTGARLTFKKGWGDPFGLTAKALEDCLLVIRHDRVMYQCKVIRREDNEVGVRFLSAAQPLPESARGN
jgi:PilZ domain